MKMGVVMSNQRNMRHGLTHMVSYGLPFIKMVLIGAGRGEMEVEVQTEQQQRATEVVQESSLQLRVVCNRLLDFN
jgi:hypothetical protein